jgi:alpha-L-fucosidase
MPDEKESLIKSLATSSSHLAGKKISDVSLLGYNGTLEWSQTEEGLKAKMTGQQPLDNAVVLKIEGAI